MAKSYDVLGLMSGTSLDGLDLVLARFIQEQTNWQFEIIKAETSPYSPSMKKKLSLLVEASGLELSHFHAEFGRWMGQEVNRFLEGVNVRPLLIASHGHTVFHRPDLGFTLQIGCGQHLHAVAGIPVVNDFRSRDVVLGGQGAPLVPIGDLLLFSEYEACLNLGGIANISVKNGGRVLAYDLTICNMALNALAAEIGQAYDSGGQLAATGKIIPELLHQLNHLAFISKEGPKSTGWEWFSQEVEPIIGPSAGELQDRLRTICEHIAMQVAESCRRQLHPPAVILVTGGGAHHDFLIKCIENHLSNGMKVFVPSNAIINFKEGLVFAFLGLLRVLKQTNVLSSVTGATKDSCAGTLYGDLTL